MELGLIKRRDDSSPSANRWSSNDPRTGTDPALLKGMSGRKLIDQQDSLKCVYSPPAASEALSAETLGHRTQGDASMTEIFAQGDLLIERVGLRQRA